MYEVIKYWEPTGLQDFAALDARVKGKPRRFTQNSDGTWSAWTLRGFLRPVAIGGHLHFRIHDGSLIPDPYPVGYSACPNGHAYYGSAPKCPKCGAEYTDEEG